MKIGLIDVDSHNFPNLALMKISAWHKSKGDIVEWCGKEAHYDIVYQSKVFDNTYSKDIDYIPDADKIIKGGTGYGLENKLPDEIENAYPDYGLYPDLTQDTAYGYLTRGCPRHCDFCIVGEKEGLVSHKVADLKEFWNGQKYIVLLDPNLTACHDRMELLQQLADSKAQVDFTQGLDARLLTRDFIEALNLVKAKCLHFAWDSMAQEESILRGLNLYKRYGGIKNYRRLKVYVLTNYNTNMKENLYRIYTLRNMGYDPYVMIYDKPNAPKEIRQLQRWVNNKRIFRTCEYFEEYLTV